MKNVNTAVPYSRLSKLTLSRIKIAFLKVLFRSGYRIKSDTQIVSIGKLSTLHAFVDVAKNGL